MANNDLIEIQNKINEHKNNLAQNLTNKRVDAEPSETFSDLIEKVKDVKGVLVDKSVYGELYGFTLTPGEGQDGFSKVTVQPIIYIENLTPENVKAGVTIYNTTGTYKGEGSGVNNIIVILYNREFVDRINNMQEDDQFHLMYENKTEFDLKEEISNEIDNGDFMITDYFQNSVEPLEIYPNIQIMKTYETNELRVVSYGDYFGLGQAEIYNLQIPQFGANVYIPVKYKTMDGQMETIEIIFTPASDYMQLQGEGYLVCKPISLK